MEEQEHDDGEWKHDGNLGIWHRGNMMMENIRMETWEYVKEGTWWWRIIGWKSGNMTENEHDDGEY
jgi:hypothetical protein